MSTPHEPVGRTKYVVEIEQEVELLRRERDESRQALGDLLAIIHRDGGHHTAFAGMSQSVTDAHAAWGATMRELDEARAEAQRLRAMLPPAAHTGVRNGPGEGSWAVFAEKVVAERDEARAQLAALREAASRARANPRPEIVAALDAAIYDPSAAAVTEAHDRRVRAAALRETAGAGAVAYGPSHRADCWAWLRDRADEIERGGR